MHLRFASDMHPRFSAGVNCRRYGTVKRVEKMYGTNGVSIDITQLGFYI